MPTVEDRHFASCSEVLGVAGLWRGYSTGRERTHEDSESSDAGADISMGIQIPKHETRGLQPSR